MTSITTQNETESMISKNIATQCSGAYKGLPVVRFKNKDGKRRCQRNEPLWAEGNIVNVEACDGTQTPGIVVAKYGRLQHYRLNWLSSSDWRKYKDKIYATFKPHLLNNNPTIQTSNEIELEKACIDLTRFLKHNTTNIKIMTKKLGEKDVLLKKSFAREKSRHDTIEKLEIVIEKQGLAITQFLKISPPACCTDSDTVSYLDDWKTENPEIAEHLCVDCGTFDYNANNNVKCIHANCPGMCGECVKTKNPEGFEICACCNKKQELECPICYTMRPIEFMAKGNNCTHHICWKCYGTASKGNNQINDCPMCRAKF
jgi:hypothetical protein